MKREINELTEKNGNIRNKWVREKNKIVEKQFK